MLRQKQRQTSEGDYCVTPLLFIAQDCAVIVWMLSSCSLVSTFIVDSQPTAVCAWSAWPNVVVGDVSGAVYFLEFTPPYNLSDDEVRMLQGAGM